MKSLRSHGVAAVVVLTLLLSALMPLQALAGDAKGVIMPDPLPGPQTAGDPDVPSGGRPQLAPMSTAITPLLISTGLFWVVIPSPSFRIVLNSRHAPPAKAQR